MSSRQLTPNLIHNASEEVDPIYTDFGDRIKVMSEGVFNIENLFGNYCPLQIKD